MKAICLMLALTLSGSAMAQEVTASTADACVAPTAPPAWDPGPPPEMPVPPKCLNLEKHTTKCSTTTFNAYNAGIADHNAKLKARIDSYNAYGRSLNAYVHAASDYANCAGAKANAQMNTDN